jgi:hypothetical protein
MNDSTEARGIARLANFRLPTDDEIQRGIDAAMADVVRRDARHNPNAFGGGGTATPVGAPTVVSGPIVTGPGETNGVPNNWGWQGSAPLGPPPGQDIIEKTVNANLGPVGGVRPKEPNDETR